MITASMVKELRELTGAGMLDCKKALEETNGNIDKASEWLREKGISKAAKKADRIAAEGLVNILINGNKAVILEVNSETDFVAKNAEFKDLINTIANLLVNSSVKTVDEAKKLETSDGTLEDTITNKIAKIGEKLSFRRFELVEKSDNETFGSYIHMNGKIGVEVKYYECYYNFYNKKSNHNVYISLKQDYRDKLSVYIENLKENKIYDSDELSRYTVKITGNKKDLERVVIN